MKCALGDVAYERDELYVGRIFKNKEDCKTKLAIHAINRKFNFIYARGVPGIIIDVRVVDACPWRVYIPRLEESER